MNSDRMHELINAWLESSLTEAEVKELNQRLRESELDRQRFRESASFHGLLHWAMAADAVANVSTVNSSFKVQKRSRFAGSAARPMLLTLLAGVLVGVSCTSFAWAVVSGLQNTSSRVDVDLVDGSFESMQGAVPSFFPDQPGVWSGDEAEVVTADWAAEGKHAVKLFRTGFSRSQLGGTARSCDVYQIVDLRPLQRARGEGKFLLELSGKFMTELVVNQPPLQAGFSLQLFDGGSRLDSANWSETRNQAISSSGSHLDVQKKSGPGEWRFLSSQCELPLNAEFAVVTLFVQNTNPSDTFDPSVGNQYVDDVRLSLLKSPH